MLQLTHSGRYARPTGAGPAPRTAYAHPLLDARLGVDGSGRRPERRRVGRLGGGVHRSRRSWPHDAGFDFVDVKACHGYLGHELSDRLPTARALRRRSGWGAPTSCAQVIEGIRSTRLRTSASRLRLSRVRLRPPRRWAPAWRRCRPETRRTLSTYAFGGDGTGLGVDLAETHELLLDLLTELGVGSGLHATAGSPYYVPHMRSVRPTSRRRTAIDPPEDPLVGVARLARRHPRGRRRLLGPTLRVVGAGTVTYLQDWLAQRRSTAGRPKGAVHSASA